jgi:hypothetical protein
MCPSMKAGFRTAKGTQVKHPMILFFKRIFPVRFWQNSALAAVIFKHWIARKASLLVRAALRVMRLENKLVHQERERTPTGWLR